MRIENVLDRIYISLLVLQPFEKQTVLRLLAEETERKQDDRVAVGDYATLFQQHLFQLQLAVHVLAVIYLELL